MRNSIFMEEELKMKHSSAFPVRTWLLCDKTAKDKREKFYFL